MSNPKFPKNSIGDDVLENGDIVDEANNLSNNSPEPAPGKLIIVSIFIPTKFDHLNFPHYH